MFVLLDTSEGSAKFAVYSTLAKAEKVAQKLLKAAKAKYSFEWDNYGDIEIYKVQVNSDKLIDYLDFNKSACIWRGSQFD